MKFLILILVLISTGKSCEERNSTEQVYRTVEQNYSGGRSSFYNDFNSHLKYPAELKSEKVIGTVYFELSIDTVGNVSKVEILKGIRDLFEKEIENKILLTNGNWIPETINGKKVSYKISENVYFELR